MTEPAGMFPAMSKASNPRRGDGVASVPENIVNAPPLLFAVAFWKIVLSRELTIVTTWARAVVGSSATTTKSPARAIMAILVRALGASAMSAHGSFLLDDGDLARIGHGEIGQLLKDQDFAADPDGLPEEVGGGVGDAAGTGLRGGGLGDCDTEVR